MRALLLALAIGTMLLGTSTAEASTGAITDAFATPDWTHASFHVQVSGSPCKVYSCSWTPAVTAQPSLPEYACRGDEALDTDPNTKTVWVGSSMSSNGSQGASLSNVSILPGVYGQRLCLVIFGERDEVSAVCESNRKVLEEFFHEPQPACQPEGFIFQEEVAGTLLSPEPPAPSGDAAETPAPAPSGAGAVPATHRGPKKCPRGKHRVRRKGRSVCVKRKRHRHHVG